MRQFKDAQAANFSGGSTVEIDAMSQAVRFP
jgi:hypothetical protein